MTPRASLVLLSALVSVPMGTPASAARAAPTCQGREATMVGEPGQVLHGSDRADVVVTGGAFQVDTRAGDDVVCVTDPTAHGKSVWLDLGPGNDSVRVRDTSPVRAFLGDGDDRYVGNDARDVVFAGRREGDDSGLPDTGTDAISTGGGPDRVTSGGQGDGDSLSLGAGDDDLRLEGDSGQADGGAGRNSVLLDVLSREEDGPGTWLLDNRVGQLSRDGEVRFSWTGFSRFALSKGEPLTVRGSKRDESFDVVGGPLTLDAGAGDDVVRLVVFGMRNSDVASVDGGVGRDRLTLSNFGGGVRDMFVDLDLARDRLRYGLGEVPRRAALAGFEDAAVDGFPEVRLHGSAAANRLEAEIPRAGRRRRERCQVTLTGGGGGDELRILSPKLDWTTKGCPAPLLVGGVGNDELIGSREDERLRGGPGRDVARGGPGVDVCVAEVRVACERR